MNNLERQNQLVPSSNPVWISDVQSREYLRNRKLKGYWTLTIDAQMVARETFNRIPYIYDDGSYFPKLSFFQIEADCAALEWDSVSQECRIWILIEEISEAEITAKIQILNKALSSFIDFRNLSLHLEEEPNVLTLASLNSTGLRELREIVSRSERRLTEQSNGGRRL